MPRCEGTDSDARDFSRGNKPPPRLAPVRKREGSSSSLVFLFLLTLVWSIAPGSAQEAPSAKQHIKIAFVKIENDPRYAPVRAYERIILKTREHPLTGAEVGIDEAAPLARVLKADFRSSVSPQNRRPTWRLPCSRQSMPAHHFFLIDAPAESYKPLADAVRGRDVLFFNVSEPEDSLRRDLCAAEFVHVYPSRAQLMDGLVQYLRLAQMARPFGPRRPARRPTRR